MEPLLAVPSLEEEAFPPAPSVAAGVLEGALEHADSAEAARRRSAVKEVRVGAIQKVIRSAPKHGSRHRSKGRVDREKKRSSR
jgi:hypothetical protein